VLSYSPGPMIRCTSMTAPIIPLESLSALTNSECTVLFILEQKESKKTKNPKIGNLSACDFPTILEVGTTWERP
jgi:hypothetical protein